MVLFISSFIVYTVLLTFLDKKDTYQRKKSCSMWMLFQFWSLDIFSTFIFGITSTITVQNLEIQNTCREWRKILILFQLCICTGLHSTACVLGTGLELRLGSTQASTGQINEQFALTDPALRLQNCNKTSLVKEKKNLRRNIRCHKPDTFLLCKDIKLQHWFFDPLKLRSKLKKWAVLVW